ncbi:hypothetical protein BRADI_3g38171v3, partial [Brachypodium distachyon]
MSVLFWNVRGLGTAGRRSQILEIIREPGVIVFCLQETIKAKFTHRELVSLGGSHSYHWAIKPTVGHSGGILIAARDDIFDCIGASQVEFFLSMVVRNKISKLQWEVMNVYGPVLHERKAEFLAEISDHVLTNDVPLVLGGDFNLIRFSGDRSRGLLHRTTM